MKVAVLVNDFGPPWDEAGKNNARIVGEALAARHEVVYLGLADETQTQAACAAEGLKGRFQPVRMRGMRSVETRWRRALALLDFIRHGKELLRSEQPDLLVSFLEVPASGMIGHMLRRRLEPALPYAQVVWTDWYSPSPAPPGIWLSEHLPNLVFNNRWAARLGLAGADLLLPTSKYLERRLRSLGMARIEPCKMGVDTARFCPGEGREDDGLPVVGYLGHVTHTKGVGRLLEAARPLVEQQKMRLRLAVTEGEEMAAVEALPSGLAEVWGIVDPSDFLPGCDLIVLPRRFSYGTASHPNVALEAMACGVPVLAADHPAMEEILEDGADGFLFPAADDAALARRLAELVGDRERLRAAGRRARERMVGEHDWGVVLPPLVSALERLGG